MLLSMCSSRSLLAAGVRLQNGEGSRCATSAESILQVIWVVLERHPGQEYWNCRLPSLIPVLRSVNVCLQQFCHGLIIVTARVLSILRQNIHSSPDHTSLIVKLSITVQTQGI